MASLIIGGSGFIGSELIRRLISAGESDIFAFQRSSSVNRLEDLIQGVKIIQGDVGSYEDVYGAVEAAQPDVIYHLAAMLSIPSEEDPAGSLRANAIGTFNVLEAARLFDVRQVLFSSSVATYAGGIEEDVISDNTIQRPSLFYGATKVFGEHMGLFYKRRYGLDFRGLRYPSIVGPNVTTPAVVQFTSWVIEQCARGNPFTIPVTPEAQVPILYYKDADRAMIELGSAPESSIDTVIYNIGGIKPVPSAGQLADEVVKHVPDAKIKFEPDPDLMVGLGGIPPMDDQRAQDEWNWRSEYDLVQMVDDFIAELNI